MKRLRRSAMATFVIFALGGPGSIEAQEFVTRQDWAYVPVDAQFWQSFQEGMASQSLEDVRSLLEDYLVDDEAKARAPLKTAEIEVAIGTYCRLRKHFGCAHAFFLEALRRAPTSMPAAEALRWLAEDSIDHPQDQIEVSRIVNTGAFKEVPPGVADLLISS